MDAIVIKKSELIEQIREDFKLWEEMSPDIDEGYFDEEDVQSYLNFLIVRGSIQNVAWTKCRTKYVKPLVHR